MSMPPQDLYHRNENSENLKDQGHDSHPPLPPMGPHVKKRRDTKSDRDSQLCDSVKMMNHLIHVDLVKLMWDLRNDILGVLVPRVRHSNHDLKEDDGRRSTSLDHDEIEEKSVL